MPGEGILSTFSLPLAVLKFLGGKLVCCKSSHDDKLDKTKLKSRVRAKLNQGSKHVKSKVKTKLNQKIETELSQRIK